jgi:methyl-accepting chemotaxis protein
MHILAASNAGVAFMTERRKLFRSRVCKRAKFVLGTSSVIDCLVHNLTDLGARVQISQTAALPERLTITFDGGRTLRSCRIVWKNPTQVGLEFLRQEPAR